MTIKGMATNESPETLGNDAKDGKNQGYPSKSLPGARELDGAQESEATRRTLSRDILTGNHAAPLGDLGSKPKTVSCPFCHQTEATKTRHKIGRCSIIWAIALLLLFWPLFWVPLVLPCCKLTSHFCPNCFEKIGASDPSCCD